WLKKCTILFRLERINDAEKCVKYLFRIDPIDWDLSKRIISLLIKNERKDIALKYIEIYGKKDSEENEYLKSLGKFYFELEKYEKAEEIYEKIFRISDTDFDVIITLSQCKILGGEFDLAMELIKKGKRIRPDDPNINELISELEKINKTREIIKDLKRFYDEIQFDIIMEKIDLDQSLLIRILESMIKKQEINAKIRSNSLFFITKTKVEKLKQTQFEGIFIGRSGYWEVNRFHFKIKLKNNSSNVITDIRIILDKFPDMLKLESQELMKISHLEPEGGLWTPEFILYAGNDCVSGKIHASIKFFDSSGKSIDYEVKPLEISYICPLLEAKNLDEINYLRWTKKMNKLEKELQLNVDYDSSILLKEITNKMEKMNLAIIKHDEDINSLYGYAEDKINHDGLALETEIRSLIDGQTKIIIKAICEKENKCASLLHKAVEEITELELSIERSIIIDKLNMFIDRPHDLNKYFKKVLKADWSDNKKDLWANTVQEILEDWKTFQPKKWVKIGKTILKFTISAIASEKLADLITSGLERLFNWIKLNLE
ncbi:MAG: tetratricopeptide repeat protein, partial [Promethearchaeota archaeon]